MRELSLSILDLVQNSVRNGSTVVEISVTEDTCKHILEISVKDNGCGMSEEAVCDIADPFYTTCTSHKVGLGVPLFIQRANLTGGECRIVSQEGNGTVISACFNTRSIDFVPLGNMSEALVCMVASTVGVDFIYTYRKNGYKFVLDTKKLFDELGVDGSTPLHFKTTLVKEYLADEIIQ